MLLASPRVLEAFDKNTKPTKGKDGHYYATVEVFHQLHCLDITRKFIWRDHYSHVDTFQDPPDMVWEHVGKYQSLIWVFTRLTEAWLWVDHCIDLLRQVIMCNGATNLLFYTDHGSLQPEARISTSHMCRNFSQIGVGVAAWFWTWYICRELRIERISRESNLAMASMHTCCI